MQLARRLEIAAAGVDLLDEVHAVAEQRWVDFQPASRDWPPAARERVWTAVRAAVTGMLTVFVDGDLDDRGWQTTLTAVRGHGEFDATQTADLVRIVRIVAVELLLRRLTQEVGLTHDERWELQRRASVYCEELLGTGEEVPAEAVTALLSELRASGIDVR
ncbi:MAG: hypothetical protein ACR2MA_09165 [Egibacteraceae bacterium]